MQQGGQINALRRGFQMQTGMQQQQMQQLMQQQFQLMQQMMAMQQQFLQNLQTQCTQQTDTTLQQAVRSNPNQLVRLAAAQELGKRKLAQGGGQRTR